ncbi:MAG: hypothetical protein ACYDAE_17335 [Steroidobacteraceae bacterium]
MKPADLVTLFTAKGVDFEHVAGSESNTHGIARRRRMGKEERKHARGRPIIETAEGVGSRVMRARAWSHAEVGIAAGGLELRAPGKPAKNANGEYRIRCPRMPWLAACYSWAGDRDGYKELHRGLTLLAIDLAKNGKWPWQIDFTEWRLQEPQGRVAVAADFGLIEPEPSRRQRPIVVPQRRRDYYLERLTELVLDDEGCRAYFTEAAKVLVQDGPYAIYMGVSQEVWERQLSTYFIEIQGQYQGWVDSARAVIGQWLREEDLRGAENADIVASEPSNAA